MLQKSIDDDSTRNVFASALGENATFIELDSHKRPLKRFKSAKSSARLTSVPSGNYGVIPSKRLIVLDIDTKVDVEEQTAAFSKIFGFNLNQTLNVKTPSGGRHFYLFAPRDIKAGEDVLPKGSLRGRMSETLKENYSLDVNLDGDLRSPQQTGYVVGPDSFSGGKKYELNENKIREISKEAFEKLSSIVKRHYERPLKRTNSRPIQKKRGRKKSSCRLEKVNLTGYARKVLNAATESSLDQSFHARRSVVALLTGCCASAEKIASICKELQLNKDTYTDSFISDDALLSDIERFLSKKGDLSHGGVGCTRLDLKIHENLYGKPPKLTSVRPKFSGFFPEGRGKAVGKKNYRVLSMDQILRHITRLSSSRSAVVRDAYGIAEHFLQPLSNSGATTVLLGHKALCEYFHASSSRITAAMRLLREAGVLEISKRQSISENGKGRTTRYSVPAHFTDSVLTSILKKTWGCHVIEDDFARHPSVSFLHRERQFVDSLSGQQLFFTSEKSTTWKPTMLVPKKLGSVLESYLANEKACRTDETGNIRPSVLWDESMSLMKTLDDDVFERETFADFEARHRREIPSEPESPSNWRDFSTALFAIEGENLIPLFGRAEKAEKEGNHSGPKTAFLRNLGENSSPRKKSRKKQKVPVDRGPPY